MYKYIVTILLAVALIGCGSSEVSTDQAGSNDQSPPADELSSTDETPPVDDTPPTDEMPPINEELPIFRSSDRVISGATQSSYVHRGEPSTNFGDESVVKIKQSNSGLLDREAYYYFDLSEFSDPVQSAYFRVGIEEYSGAAIQVATSDSNWSAASVDWDSRITSSTRLVGVPAVNDDYLKVDVADIINSYLAKGIGGITFIISALEVTANSLELAGAGHSSSYKRPRLYVDLADDNNPFTYGIDYAESSRGAYTAHTLKDVSGEAELSEYGGWLDWNLGATGYFRTQKVDDAWIMVDPLGYAFITVGLNSVIQVAGANLPADIKSFGINTMGSWSDESIANIPYSPRWNFMLGFKNTTDELKALYASQLVPVFDPGFAAYVDEAAKGMAAKKDDRFILGHFSDNELPFHKDQLSLSLKLDSSNAHFQEADGWVRERYGSDYNTKDLTDSDEESYRGHVAETYYRIVSAAIKRHDPNHLFLGTRFHSSAKYSEAILEAAGKYTDVISVNYYGAWAPENSTVRMWEAVADKPFFVTEFYTKAADTGLANEDGAGWLVETQQDRSNYFENFAIKLLECKSCVGWHWFRFIDNNDANKGVYDLSHRAYTTLQDSMAQIAQNLYQLRSHLLYRNTDFNGEVETSQPIILRR